jgi:DHA2 family multidrug resistance protein
MVAETEDHPSESVTAAVWAGFAMMCIGMFMAILDVQVVATSLATIQQALDIAQDQMSWIQTAYLIAEIISIPLTGFLTRLFTMRWLLLLPCRCSRWHRSPAPQAQTFRLSSPFASCRDFPAAH